MSHQRIISLFVFIFTISFASAQSDRPNILFCITDDQSWVHTSYAGEKAIETPAFDRIANEGLYFKNAFSASPSCSPSRGAIITGQEIWRLGEAAQLFSAVPTELEKYSFPVLLRANDYFTGYTQKGWAPNNFEVHGWETYPLGKRYVSHEITPPASRIVANNYSKNFEDFLKERPEEQPFFFWFGSSEPHRAFEENSGSRNGVDPDKVHVPGFLPDVPEVRNDIADYLFEIKWVDQHLEKMIALLEEKGLLANTIIIVSSDNGMAFPSAKNNLYEYGLHMPLAIRWPEGIQKKGRVIEDLVSLTDLAPTLLEYADIEVPKEMTGKSLKKIFETRKAGRIEKSRKYVYAGKERHTLCRENELPYPQRSVRDYQYLYIRNLAPDRWPAGDPKVKSNHGWVYGDIDLSPSQIYLIENAEDPEVKEMAKLAFNKRPYEELYDVIKDPYCLKNLALENNFNNQKNRLSIVLEDYLLRTEDPRSVKGESIWDDFPYYFDNPQGLVPYPYKSNN